jgi:ketosteroid isomerase-like protein
VGHPNEELLHAAYGMRDEGEVASVRDLFGEHVVWHTRRGDLHGPDEVAAMLGASDHIAEGSTAREVHAVLADDEYGMVFVTVRAQRRGQRFEDRQVHVYRFAAGRIAEFWEFVSDQRAIEEFWSR